MSFSRAAEASSASSAGMAAASNLPLSSRLQVRAFISSRFTTPRKSFSAPMGSWTGMAVRPNREWIDSRAREWLERSRSSLLMKRRRGSSNSSA